MKKNPFSLKAGLCRSFFLACAVLLFFFIFSAAPCFGQTARDIVARSNDLLHGKSSKGTSVMTVIKPDWSRKMTTKSWMLEPDFALILITEPAKEKGTVTLKRKKEIWNWIPAIERIIKIPPSMMMQPWMGSDFNNDDLVRESSILEDYTHKLDSEEKCNGYLCYRIILTPKPEAGIVWGRVLMWISKDGFMQLKTEYFDEEGMLVKSMIGSNVKEMGGRTIPSRWEMIPADKPGEKTILEYTALEFDMDIEESFFSRQRMKRVR